MRIVAVLLGVVAAAAAYTFLDLFSEEWHAFKLEHDKQYESEKMEGIRMKIYKANRVHIARHNQRYEQGLVSYKLRVNKYSDMLNQEFTHCMNGFNMTVGNKGFRSQHNEMAGPKFIAPANTDVPDQVDWRVEGAVTPVKDQGKCGSCWSFSTTGALEAQHFRDTGRLVPLSEQNLIDCSTAYGNEGCQGGTMTNAFQYIKDNKGIDTESSYPYEARNDVCRFDPAYIGAVDFGYMRVPSQDEELLKKAVATVGPISVAIDASRMSFQFYSEGVYYDAECSTTKLNHAVLVVGYGTDERGGDYWLVKNSWGKSWGQGGYIKMARNRHNNCGIATYATYPIV